MPCVTADRALIIILGIPEPRTSDVTIFINPTINHIVPILLGDCRWLSGGGWWAVACTLCVLCGELVPSLRGGHWLPEAMLVLLRLASDAPIAIIVVRCDNSPA